MIKEKLFLYAILLAAGWVFYKLITYFIIYSRIKKKFKNGDLHDFTNQFGEDYVFRFSSNDTRRYKWKKGLLVIKASFDNDDKLTGNRVLSFDFFTLFTKVIFS
jgi:hypothetical protein